MGDDRMAPAAIGSKRGGAAGIEERNQRGALGRRCHRIEAEIRGADLARDLKAAPRRLGKAGRGVPPARFPRQAVLPDQGPLGGHGDFCKAQRMPLLIAVATAIARLLAESLRMEEVT